MDIKNSSISTIKIEDRTFYIKRDDLVDPFLAGNKYRKLYSLLQIPPNKYNKIISYGGTQSNAMLAIAALCNKKGWEFIYYTKPLAKILKEQRYGNYSCALSLGMKHIELGHNHYREYIASLRLGLDSKTFMIDQGGADVSAKEGLNVLAQEIRSADIDTKSLATPSGTGTTALYLAQALPEYKIYTVPCVGDAIYLKKQMQALYEIPENLIVLNPNKKYHFAKPYPEFLTIYKKLLDAGIEFDLLYAPSMWLSLLEHTKEDLLYIHSGGVTGNESMLQRYKSKNILPL